MKVKLLGSIKIYSVSTSPSKREIFAIYSLEGSWKKWQCAGPIGGTTMDKMLAEAGNEAQSHCYRNWEKLSDLGFETEKEALKSLSGDVVERERKKLLRQKTEAELKVKELEKKLERL